MTEMTAEKVKTLLESFAALCGSNAKAKELCSDAIKFVEQQAQEIERLNKSLQYEQHRTGRQGTHAEGCYKWGPEHWDCAVQEIERLQAENEGMRCCGNCIWFRNMGMWSKCRESDRSTAGNRKCDKWEGLK